MKYINKTTNPIFVKIKEVSQFIQPGQEIVSESSLGSYGLVPCEVIKPEPIATPKVTPKVTPKSKPVKSNEFTATDKTQD